MELRSSKMEKDGVPGMRLIPSASTFSADSAPQHPSFFSHRYTSADLDRLIGYKIAPDARTRKVDTHKVSEDETVKDKTRRGWTRATVTGKDEGGDSSNSTASDLEMNP